MSKTYRPLIWIVLSFGTGIFVHQFFNLSFTLVGLFAIVLSGLCLGTLRKSLLSTALLLVTFLGLGCLYAHSFATLPKNHIWFITKYYRQKPVSIEGIVVSNIQKRDFFESQKTSFTLKVHQVQSPWGWRARSGKILVNIFQDLQVSYGDVLRLEGTLHQPFNFSEDERFSYQDYLNHRGIKLILSVKKNAAVETLRQGMGNYFKGLSFKIRENLKALLQSNLTKNEAGLMQAMLLGDRSQIPAHIRTLFVQTGTVHILAISGLHIGIVGGLFFVLLKIIPIGRKSQILLTILMLISYSFMTGGRPSVIRATIMAVIFLASFIFEREPDHLNTLSFAGLIILLLNPFYLFDVGFQLSFACILSIVLFGPKIKLTLSKLLAFKTDQGIQRGLLGFCVHSFSTSLAVWIGVAGLIAFYFQIVTPVTIWVNLIVIPIMAVVIILGFGLLAVGYLLPSLTFLFAICLKLALNVMVGLIFVFDKLPFAHIYVNNLAFWHMMSYYIVITFVFIFPYQKSVQKFTLFSPKIN